MVFDCDSKQEKQLITGQASFYTLALRYHHYTHAHTLAINGILCLLNIMRKNDKHEKEPSIVTSSTADLTTFCAKKRFAINFTLLCRSWI